MSVETEQNDQSNKNGQSRREFLIKTSYTAPAIVSLSAIPSFASAGSSDYGRTKDRDNGRRKERDSDRRRRSHRGGGRR